MRTVSLVLGLLALFAFCAFAADIDGKWKSQFQTQDGQTRETTYTFKADGNTLTGTISGRGGETAINDGKINGDEISFTVIRKFNDQEFKMEYKGKVSGNEIKFTVNAGERSFELTAKKI